VCHFWHQDLAEPRGPAQWQLQAWPVYRRGDRLSQVAKAAHTSKAARLKICGSGAPDCCTLNAAHPNSSSGIREFSSTSHDKWSAFPSTRRLISCGPGSSSFSYSHVFASNREFLFYGSDGKFEVTLIDQHAHFAPRTGQTPVVSFEMTCQCCFGHRTHFSTRLGCSLLAGLSARLLSRSPGKDVRGNLRLRCY
jgi:hypothetical protein